MNLLAFLKQSTLYLIRSVERLFVCLFVCFAGKFGVVCRSSSRYIWENSL